MTAYKKFVLTVVKTLNPYDNEIDKKVDAMIALEKRLAEVNISKITY